MPGGAEEGIGIEMLPLVLSLSLVETVEITTDKYCNQRIIRAHEK